MSQNNEKNKNSVFKKFINGKWLLIVYDLILMLAVEALLLGIYKGVENLEIKDKLIISAVAIVSIFVMRAIWSVYKQVWRYGGIQSYIRVLLADAFACILFYLVERLLPVNHVSTVRILCISCLICLGSLTMRMVYRYAYKCARKNTWIGKVLNILVKIFAGNRIELDNSDATNKIRVAIVGAGKVGVSLAEELLGNRTAAYVPKCFIDTDPDKSGRNIQSLPVLDESSVTEEVLSHYEIQEVIFALPQLSLEEKKKLYEKYKPLRCKVKVYDYPTMQQAGNGKRYLREFDVEDLLFRRPIVVTDEKTDAYYRDKVVLITGGGGSIGSELCRQVATMKPKKLVLLDVYENGVYDIQQELAQAYKDDLDVSVEILSVCNRPALERVFDNYRPNIVIHAAAHKHVPLMEHNCCEAIENNVFGTLNTVELSEKYRVQRFMMVSTDKAVNPTNVMGSTKRMCEMIVLCHSRTSSYTTYSATRFGNVLGSAGSVIPLFKRQILNNGPLTITDKRIIRYFMTIPEASQLVLQSGAMAKNGELFVLDMGKPVKILDLAENMIRLSGFEPYKDIDIIETGLRPGEKLYEELLVDTEVLDKTENSLIFIERDEPISENQLAEKLELLKKAYLSGDENKAKEALKIAVPTFRDPKVVNAEASNAKEMKITANVR